MRSLEIVALAKDELEAVRLTDLEGLYQEQAAKQMGVSRQTLGNILKRAHRKIAEALIEGKAIQLESVCPKLAAGQSTQGGGSCRRKGGRGRCGGRGEHKF